ncbi:beta strand repeat-containing protein, partial [Dongia sp.]|uniref:beta strand repeat-containing protein n=1 Tax=Dongia sp. TaxID=1977262 RepID=UPI0037505050
MFDAQNDGKIDQKNEIVFTEWDKSAKSDMQALRSVFDTNQNGKLDSGDAQFSQFKVWVTNADGTRTLQTLAVAGIASINLIENEVEITLPDGSKITGQTTYDKVGGGTGTAATVSLATEAQGYALDHSESVSGAVTTIDNKARNADGSIASETKSVYDSATKIDTTSFDNDGDGIWDRVQTTDRSVSGTVTITNRTLAGVLIDKTETVISGSTTTISRDLTGQGYYGQVETRTTNADTSLSITITDKNADGSTISATTRTTSFDKTSGEILGRSETVDRNFDGVIDWTVTDNTVINGDKSRTETVIDKAGSTLLGVQVSKITTITSADGQTKTITADLDGDGDTDLTSAQDITSSTVSGTTTSQTKMSDTAGDGTTLISKTQLDQTADSLGNVQTVTQVDRDGNSIFDLKTDDKTTVSTGYRTQVVQTIAGDGVTLLGKTTTVKYDDGRSRNVQIDANGDGKNDQTEIISIDGAGISTDTVTRLTAQGTTITQSITTTSADGLSVTMLSDADGNGVYDSKVTDVTVITAGVSTVETVTTTNKDGTLRGSQTVTRTADGLKITSESDLNGDTYADLTTKDFTVINAGHTTDYEVRTISNTNKDASLRNQVVTTTSLNQRNITVQTNLDGDATFDQVETIVIENGGDTVDTVSHYAGGTVLKYQTVVTTTDDKLSVTAKEDWNGDGKFELTTTDVTVLNADGTRTETISNNAGATLLNQTTIATSANGLSKTTKLDQNGDLTVDVTMTDVTALNADGSRTETVQRSNAAGLIDKSVVTVSGNKLSTTTELDQNGDNAVDLTRTDVTALRLDGSQSRTVTDKNTDGSLRQQTTTQTSADRKTVSTTRALAGKTVQTETDVLQATGEMVNTVVTMAAATGAVISTVVSTTSANGLSKSVEYRDSTGQVIDTQKSVTVLNADGSRTTTFTETGVATDQVTTTFSDDGLTRSTALSLTSAIGTTALNAMDVTELAADGSRTQTVTVTGAAGALLGKTVGYTSDDGLISTLAVDVNGDGRSDVATSKVIATDGSSTEVRLLTQVATGALVRQDEVTTSADGRTTVTRTDSDGIAGFDRTETRLRNADGSVTTTITGDSVFNAPAYGRTILAAKNTEGGTTVTASDLAAGGGLIATATTTISANGLATITGFDADADGVVDLVESDVTVLKSDGSQVRTDSFTYAGGIVGSKNETVMSADGLTTTLNVDNDANGILDFSYTKAMALDGSAVITRTWFDNVTGTQLEKQTSTISVGGLVTTDNSKGFTDVTTEYAGAEGSYQWIRKVSGAGVGSATHVIDAAGIDTWSWNINNTTGWAGTTGDTIVTASGSIRIDQASAAEAQDQASAIYVGLLGRSMTADEQQMLAQYISGSVLNRTLLATNIIASAEFTSRYGTLTDGAFVNALYLNLFGAEPSAAQRADFLAKLTAGTLNRAAVVVAVAESADNGIVYRDGIFNGVGPSVVSYSNADAGVTVNLATPANNAGAASGDTYFNIRTVIGSGFDDKLTGDSSDNTLVGGAGGDALDGGTGNDTASYATSKSGVTANLATPSANTGDAYKDTYTAIDNLVGTSFNDTLTGDGSANILIGGTGADALDGAGGTDTASYATASAAVTVNLASSGYNTGDAAGDTYASIENLTGSAFNDVLSGNGSANVIDGGAGIDTADYSKAASAVYIRNDGTASSWGEAAGDMLVNVERMIGGAYNDQIQGGSGNDFLDGGASNDRLEGFNGDDTYVVDNVNDFINEYANYGTDTVQSSINWTLIVNLENLTLTGTSAINGTGNSVDNVITGNSAANTLTGAAGNDTLDGGAGNDTLVGGTGDDTYVVDNAGDVVTESASEGTDLVKSSVSWTLGANLENLTLTGSNAVDGTGNSGSNSLTGNTAANTLDGGAGSDILDGGAGADTLIGGDGSDTYYVDDAGDVVVETGAASTPYTPPSGFTVVGTADLNGDGQTDVLLWNATTNVTQLQVVKDGVGETPISVPYWANWTVVGLADLDADGDKDILYKYNTSNEQEAVYLNGTTVVSQAYLGVAGKTVDSLIPVNGLGKDTVVASIDYMLGANLENLTLTGTGSINGTGNTLDNVLTGNSASNTLAGGAGNDTLDGGLGADTLAGGAGNDTYLVDRTDDVIVENVGEGTDLVQSAASYALSANIENLTLTGTAAINGTGNASDNT